MPRVDARIVLSLALLLLLALSAAAAPYSFGSPATAVSAVDAALAELGRAEVVRELRRDRFAVRDVAIESMPSGTVAVRSLRSNGRRAE